MTAVRCCRHNTRFEAGDRVFFEEYSSGAEADAAFALLKRLLELGADVNARESHGATLAWRTCRTAADMLPQYHWNDDTVASTAIVTPEGEHDLKRIFLLLKAYHTDFSEEEIQRYIEKPQHPLTPFLRAITD